MKIKRKGLIPVDVIFTRRSVRSYTSEPVADETVAYLLQAAMTAPSAGNQQPWEFIVVRDRASLIEITKVHEYSQMLKEAPIAIVVCADPGRSKYPYDYWIQDCAAATQNILLAAATKGLGSCWLGIHPHPERVAALRRIFGLPDPVVPFAVVALGHPHKPTQPVDRFDASRVHRDKW